MKLIDRMIAFEKACVMCGLTPRCETCNYHSRITVQQWGEDNADNPYFKRLVELVGSSPETFITACHDIAKGKTTPSEASGQTRAWAVMLCYHSLTVKGDGVKVILDSGRFWWETHYVGCKSIAKIDVQLDMCGYGHVGTLPNPIPSVTNKLFVRICDAPSPDDIKRAIDQAAAAMAERFVKLIRELNTNQSIRASCKNLVAERITREMEKT